MSIKFADYKGLDLPKVAEDVLEFWKKEGIFEKSMNTREGNEPFVFFEGPPSANGLPGIHHVMARAIKDIFCRYKTQKGFQVKRKAGWDTHGLPVELGVEKALGITKEDIGKKISVEEYNQACRNAVMKYTDVWNDLTEKIGYWVDMEDPYITYKPKYMESVWWILSQMYKKGLIYKGYTIQPYSPKAGTGLSSHELNQPGTYQDVTDTTVVAQFKAIENSLPIFLQEYGTIHFLAWTTTPWTLPSNTALTVGPKIDYVLVETFNQYTFEATKVILAKNLVGKQFAGKKFNQVDEASGIEVYTAGDKVIPYRVIKEFKGKDLLDIRYEQLLDYVQPNTNPENAFRVILGDFVTTEDGTGIVHTAPTFGADDALVAKQAKPEVPPMLVMDENDNLVPLVNLQGKFTSHMGAFAGKYVKNDYYNEGEAPERSVDVEIAIKLKEENKAFKVEKYEHSYPHCWRTDKPVLYYPLDSWFIKTTAYKERLVELNQTVNWKPTSTGTGRFGNWLENLVDWNLSRSRFWGTPLPIWRTEDGQEERCIGSIDELEQAVNESIAKGFMDAPLGADFDLHRPYVDDVILVSPQGKKMYREKDLIDVWFDSGAMPYAQWHYPFEQQDVFEKNFPADYISEGVDQTRGWFFTLHAIAGMLFDSVAFKNVIATGLVLDKNGNKMSKRLGNGVDPFKTLDQYGADPTRWYMMVNANPWDNLKFDIAGVEEVQRRFFGTIHNTYAFFALYANIDAFTFGDQTVQPTNESDRWIISKLHSLIKQVDAAYDDYEPTKAVRPIQEFVVNDLSNWYVRLNRKRFWNPAKLQSESALDKKCAYQTLYTCLETVAKLIAPVAPFYADRLYSDLNNVSGNEQHDSVHLSDFPTANEHLVDQDLEQKMQLAQDISSMVHSLRKKQKIKVRQPLSKILIPVLHIKVKHQLEAVEELIKSEVNVKQVEYVDDTSGIIVKKVKPNFRKLGQQYGPLVKDLSALINQFHHDEIKVLEDGSELEVHVKDQTVYLTAEDVQIVSEDIPGWLVANENNLTVALDINITDDLKQEGIARDVINRVQNLRKDMGLEVQDKIHIKVEKNQDLMNQALEANKEYICQETQALSLSMLEELPQGRLLELDDIKLKIQIEV